MTYEEAEQKNKKDVFEIGIYAIEFAIIIAIAYAMVAFPMWLKPATS